MLFEIIVLLGIVKVIEMNFRCWLKWGWGPGREDMKFSEEFLGFQLRYLQSFLGDLR